MVSADRRLRRACWTDPVCSSRGSDVDCSSRCALTRAVTRDKRSKLIGQFVGSMFACCLILQWLFGDDNDDADDGEVEVEVEVEVVVVIMD